VKGRERNPACISAPAAPRVGARLIRVGRKRGAMTGFKNFVVRGNLVELAVAVVIGTQFSSLVKQFVSSFIDPLLSLVGGTPDFGKLVLHVGKATFTYGQFLTEALTFLISALVVY
jgi:large conductance mechanosensitive channel